MTTPLPLFPHSARSSGSVLMHSVIFVFGADPIADEPVINDLADFQPQHAS